MNAATIIGSMMLAAIPPLISALPPQYQAIATALITGIASVYHLYQSPPAGK